MSKKKQDTATKPPTNFGDQHFGAALVNVTNVCNLSCAHCFVFREDNPNSPRDKMDDATMLAQLEALRDKHDIHYMLFMGGEPMIRKDLVLKAMKLFDACAIVTNGTYGIPSVPGHLVTVSLDGPEEPNDRIRGEGVFQKVKRAIVDRDPNDGTTVMLQMAITADNEAGLEEYVEEVKDWPVTGLAFTFYVPPKDDNSSMVWKDLRDPLP
jgi:MoaA/NifB/PqqE/SkfB family radical SAM enzyme